MKYKIWKIVSLTAFLFSCSTTKEIKKNASKTETLVENKCRPHLPFCAIGPIMSVAGKDISPDSFNEQVEAFDFYPSMEKEKIIAIKTGFLKLRRATEILKYDTKGHMDLVSKEAVESSIVYSLKQLDNQGTDFQDFLKQIKMSDKSFRLQMHRGLVIKKLFPEVFNISVNWKAVRNYYDTHIDDYRAEANSNGVSETHAAIPYEKVKDDIAEKLHATDFDDASGRYFRTRARDIPVKLFDQNIIYNSEFSKLSLFDARQGFTTVLEGAETNQGIPDTPPTNSPFTLVHYQASDGPLAAYLTKDPGKGKKHPAIIWITGGDSNSIGNVWSRRGRENDQSASGFRRKGVVMMFPSLRGGNDNPGRREGFYGELDDILDAKKYLDTLPYVDPEQIYLGGHSTGGTMVMLAGAYSNAFRAIFAFGPVDWIEGYGSDFIYYDSTNKKEMTLRSPKAWLHSIKTPMYIFEGEVGNADSIESMKKNNTNSNLHFFVLPGFDHFSILAPLTDFIGKQIIDGVIDVSPEKIKRLKTLKRKSEIEAIGK